MRGALFNRLVLTVVLLGLVACKDSPSRPTPGPGGGGFTVFSLFVEKFGAGTGRVTSSVGGVDCGDVCGATFLTATEVTLAAEPDEGFRFAGFSGEADCEDGEITVNVEELTCLANFELENDPPLADAGGPYTGMEDQPVTLDGSGSSDPEGSIASYEWDFGDGESGSRVTTSHTYAEGGIYDITLTVTDDVGFTSSASTVATIQSNAGPTAVPGGPYAGAVGTPVTVDGSASFDPDGSVTAYAWDFGDGGTGMGATASHAYAAPGVYDLALTVTDERGATHVGSTTVTIRTSLGATAFLAYGDSTTFGIVGAVGSAESYPTQLHDMLIERYPEQEQDFVMDNEGVPGLRASDAVGGLSFVTQQYPYDALLLHFGANDIRTGTIEDASNAIDGMTAEARGRGLEVFLATLPVQAGLEVQIGILNAEIVSIAARDGAILVDLAQDVELGSGAHPTAFGYGTMAERFFEAIVSRFDSGPSSPAARGTYGALLAFPMGRRRGFR